MTNVQRTHTHEQAVPDPQSMMRAIVHDRYGSPNVLEIRDVAIPAPAAGEVLVRVTAASLNPLDWHFTTGRPYFMRLLYGLRRPKQPILGADVAGRIVALGEDVTDVAVGDRVAGVASGSLAEYAIARASRLAVVPDALTDEEAAAIPLAGITALQAVRDQGRVSAGQQVLVIGAGGGVGVHAVQLAVAAGAIVTGVCSTGNVDLVRSLGAAAVVDHTTSDWATKDGATKDGATKGGADGSRYDVIIDNVGTRPLGVCRRALVKGGTYVMIGGPKANPWLDPLARVVAGKIRFAVRSEQFRQFTATTSADDLRVLWDHVDAGRMRPVIGRRIHLAEVPEAISRFGTGRASGKTVVHVAGTHPMGATS